MGRVAVLSHVVRDIVMRPGRADVEQVGGAGAYAAVGAALASEHGDRPVLVAGTGRADLDLLREWAVVRNIDPAGLFVVGERGPTTEVVYRDDADRTETPRFGLEHFIAHTPLPEHVPDPAIDGLYLFHNSEPDYWDAVERHRGERHGGQVALWEIAADACLPELLPEVVRAAGLVDALVINLLEACDLFGSTDLDAVFRSTAALAPIVLVHHGTAGSKLFTPDGVHDIGIRRVFAIDVTGGGNSFAGAFLQGLVDGRGPVAAARLAASTAAEVVASAGAPLVTSAQRSAVRFGAARVRLGDGSLLPSL